MNRYGNRYIRPVWAEINLAALRHNIVAIRDLIGSNVEMMAVVKAEAYGHGALEVARVACDAGVTYLGVALPEEGIALREGGITTPILVFAPLQQDQVQAFLQYDLTATICSLETAVALSQAATAQGRTVPVHLKVDTGMGRIGIPCGEAVSFLRSLVPLSGIKVDGIFSHLATADEADKEYANLQVERYTAMVARIKEAGLLPRRLHLANSAATMEIPAAYFTMVRPGIILYGMYPSKEVDHSKIKLRPVLSLKARVIFTKRVAAGTGISYGQKYHTSHETTIVTLPVGYADGWSRRLSNQAEVLIGGKRYPIVGTICMDQCMVDVGDDPVKTGDEAVLIGVQGRECITADDLAARLGTINYEITCMLSDRVPRLYIR